MDLMVKDGRSLSCDLLINQSVATSIKCFSVWFAKNSLTKKNPNRLEGKNELLVTK
jgi:hypothetical protein